MRRITHEVAVLAAAKGYDEPQDLMYSDDNVLTSCTGYKNQNFHSFADPCSAPYQVELCDWLREKKGVHLWTDVDINIKINNLAGYYVFASFTENGRPAYSVDIMNILYPTHEEALEAGLKAILQRL